MKIFINFSPHKSYFLEKIPKEIVNSNKVSFTQNKSISIVGDNKKAPTTYIPTRPAKRGYNSDEIDDKIIINNITNRILEKI